MRPSRTGNKSVVCALTASYISTLAGYPVRPLACPGIESCLIAIVPVGLVEVEVTDHQDTRFSSQTSRVGVSGGGRERVLSWVMDSSCHDIIRS